MFGDGFEVCVIHTSVGNKMSMTGLKKEAGKLDAYTGAKRLIDLITGTVMYFDRNDLSPSKDDDSNLTFCVNRCPGQKSATH
ncbi:MAG: hypothetical protein WED05_08615 [Candidatus Atabeyarchaeum deiterrae]